MLRLLCALVSVALLADAAELPTGTEMHVRLTGKVATDTAQPKQSVDAVVIAPVLVNGVVVIPSGSSVSGSVESVTKLSETDNTQPAALLLTFQRIRVGTTALPLAARVSAVDNARETVDRDGRIVGINPHEAFTTRIDQGLNKLKSSDRFGGLAGLLEGVKEAVVKDVDPNIVYDAATEMSLRLTTPLVIPATLHVPQPALPPFPNDRVLSELVNGQPFQTYSQGSRVASDITNVMFIGSRDEIEAAFTEAGWSGAARLNRAAKFETAMAMIEQRGYSEAPVSVLMLNNRPPDLVYQKGNDTFAKRHHLRMWKSADTYNGREVWVCSSTHDVAIAFSEHAGTFIHKIDSNIDLERAKVVTDIMFTGKVRSLALVERPNVPQHAKNATGDDIDTDGSMAVILLQ